MKQEQDPLPPGPAPRAELDPRQGKAAFDLRAEAALREYLRTGEAVPAHEVLDALQARLDARRRALSEGRGTAPARA